MHTRLSLRLGSIEGLIWPGICHDFPWRKAEDYIQVPSVGAKCYCTHYYKCVSYLGQIAVTWHFTEVIWPNKRH